MQLARRRAPIAGHHEVVRAHAELHLATRGELGVAAQVGAHADALPFDEDLTSAAGERAFEEVHGRRAEERGDEHAVGLLVDLERWAALLDEAAVQHPERVGEGHRLDLVVGDVERRGAEPVVQATDVDAHLGAEGGVQVGERLVEQVHVRAAHDRAAHGDALALAAGELLREPIEQLLEAEHVARLADPLLDLRGRRAPQREPEGQVVPHRQVRVERVALEHHGDVAIARGRARDVFALDEDLPLVGLLEARDQAEQGRLSAPARAHEHREAALGDHHVDPAEDGVARERLLHAARLAADGPRGGGGRNLCLLARLHACECTRCARTAL